LQSGFVPTLSACLIVRDEEENLEACLEALEPFVDEICVLDTGSVDRSLAVAEGFGARTGRFEWCDDFAAARNACLELATSDWVLSVDADELLDPESASGLRTLLEDKAPQAYLVWLDNLDGSRDKQGRPGLSSVAIPRLFRRRAEIRWSRPVHESVQASLLAMGGGDLEHSHLRLVHHGYLPEVVRAGGKRERNLAILERRGLEEPGDLFNGFKLATTQVSLGREEDAAAVLDRVWLEAGRLSDSARVQRPFLPLAAAGLVRLHQAAGRSSRAWAVAQEALADYPTVSEVLYQAAEVQRRCGLLEGAGELYAAARGCEPWTDLYAGDPATRKHLPLLGLARVGALAGDLQLASECVDQALELAPEDYESRVLGVRLDAVRGEAPRAWSALEDLLQEGPGQPWVQLLAAEMAWSQGEVATAHGFWIGALSSPVSESAARAWLTMEHLVAGEFEAALAEGEKVRAADLPQSGALVVLAAIEERALQLDPLVDARACLGEVSAWLGELARDPQGRAVGAFARGAGALEPRLPGISTLLRGD
jgi:tetratricopeptide (TPR) repeat protein